MVLATDPAKATYNRARRTKELIGKRELETFEKFGLRYLGGSRLGLEGRRRLRFGPSDARDVLRA